MKHIAVKSTKELDANKSKELKQKKIKHRIPYDVWINSQMSIARHFGGLKINGKTYLLDFKDCRKEIIDGKEKFFPDLVEM